MQLDLNELRNLMIAYIQVRKPFVSLIINNLKAVQSKGLRPT